jgi:hypothetical protein
MLLNFPRMIFAHPIISRVHKTGFRETDLHIMYQYIHFQGQIMLKTYLIIWILITVTTWSISGPTLWSHGVTSDVIECRVTSSNNTWRHMEARDMAGRGRHRYQLTPSSARVIIVLRIVAIRREITEMEKD